MTDRAYRLFWYIVIGFLTYALNNYLLFTFRGTNKFSDTVSVAMAFFITSLCHFVLHNTITFRKSSQSFRKKFLGHLTVVIINYIAGVTTAALTLKYIWDNNFFATACSTAVTFTLGYGLFNKFVYKTDRRSN